ncbi:MAG: stage II sporulation protein D [Syntrophomonadaceae bacterium]
MAVVLASLGLMRALKKPPPGSEPLITLYLSAEDRVIELGLEEYLVGTVAAEMPADFGLEALKAQAVCARTYAVRKIIEGRDYPRGAHLTDDINNCQAYVSGDEFARRNPANYRELWSKIEKAVQATRGIIMVYDQQPIDALYHSTCGGKTESALASTGKDIPYLRSVSCQYCQASRYYESQQVFSPQQLQNLIKEKPDDKISLKITSRTPAGRVSRLEVNGQSLYAETFRRWLGLPSTWWNLSLDEGYLVVNSRGYGHGLGMCQYGAGGMAAAQKSYKQILQHYYQHIELLSLNY